MAEAFTLQSAQRPAHLLALLTDDVSGPVLEVACQECLLQSTEENFDSGATSVNLDLGRLD